MIKLIASDLDDTLLDQNSQLSAENIRAIREVLAQGYIFTLATGRMFQSAAPFARQLGLPVDQPIICYNGALIKRLSGEIIYEKPLPSELAAAIADYGQKKGWTINAYYQDELYVPVRNRHVEDYMQEAQVEARVVGDLVNFIRDGNKSLSKLLVIGPPQEMPGRNAELNSLFGSQVKLVSSRDKYIEVTSPTAHKGEALVWLANQLGVQASEVMAIGDGNNDLTMIEMVGFGVAVANAAPKVKENARYHTSANYENGVAKILSELVLQHNNQGRW